VSCHSPGKGGKRRGGGAKSPNGFHKKREKNGKSGRNLGPHNSWGKGKKKRGIAIQKERKGKKQT